MCAGCPPLFEPPSHFTQILIRPIYAALPSSKQMEVFEPAPRGTRKVILATNIAEAAVTIPGVKFVIDGGLCKEKVFAHKQRGGGELVLRLLVFFSHAYQELKH